MKHLGVTLALVGALVLPLPLCACNGQGAGATGGEAEQASAPVLDGAWKQVDHTTGQDGMVGAIDGDMIALWIRANGYDWPYWVGTFEAPTSDKAYSWTSTADHSRMTGLFSSQDDTKDFSYDDGKITFKFSMQGQSVDLTLEQANETTGLLEDLKSDEGKPVEKDAEVKDLEIEGSGYTLSRGYVFYGVQITNPNDGIAPESAIVSVVGRAQDGSIRFVDESTVGTTLPGATTYWAGQAGNGDTEDTDTIEIKVSVNDGAWYKTTKTDGFYKIENLKTDLDSEFIDNMRTTGEITLTEDVDLKGSHSAKDPVIVCIMRSADGGIIGGYTTHLQADLKVGEPTAFEATNYAAPDDCDKVEVYANPWGITSLTDVFSEALGAEKAPV